jgi:hypothetical protein
MVFKSFLCSVIATNLIIPSFLFGFSSLSCVSQSLPTIDLHEIHQKQIRKYIHARAIDQIQDFSSIHPSWKKQIKESDFHVNERIFFLKNSLSDVWECYRHANLVKSWNGHSVRFGLLIAKGSNSVIYANTSVCPQIDTGQIYFLNLGLLKGLFHIPVAFEIINIDPLIEKLELSYLEDNKSRGKQTLQFFDNGDGRTRIVHTSYFKSNSRLRDDLLYPYFHKRFIREFHRNMGQLVKKT